MAHRFVRPGVLLVLLALVLSGAAAGADPLPRVIPPTGARFLVDQKFDIRAEIDAPASPSSLKLYVDGRRIPSSRLFADAAGRGQNLRSYSFDEPGKHKLRVTDAAGAEAVSEIEVIDPFRSEHRGFSGRDGDDDRPVRNVIILLGDGMGASHRTAARIVRYGVAGGRAKGLLAMDGMPGTGMIMTASLNSIVTDSAPGMQNYVTGNKANNNQEGVFPDNTPDAFDNPRIEYLSEYLHRKDRKSLGIVTTADVEDATPAANAVHTSNRGAGTGICDQFLDESDRSGLTVLMGGGRRWFLPSTEFGSSRSASTDYVLPQDVALGYDVIPGAIDPNRNLLGDFQARGFRYASSRTELLAVPPNTKKLLGLFGYGNMNVSYDKVRAARGDADAQSILDDYHAPDQPMLDEMTDAALKVLDKNESGFVLLVEGAHIDKQSHLMDADRAIWETIEFDRAVARALAFAKKDGNTLVLVTADHECSGFSIIGAATLTASDLQNLPSDAALVDPTQHPARQAAVGIYDAAGFPAYTILPDGFPSTADIDHKVQVGFGASGDRYETWLAKSRPVIDSLLPTAIRGELLAGGYPPEPINREPDRTFGFFIRGEQSTTQAVHTATDIPISAYSSGGDAWRDFVGVMDNTDVFFKILKNALRSHDRH